MDDGGVGGNRSRLTGITSQCQYGGRARLVCWMQAVDRAETFGLASPASGEVGQAGDAAGDAAQPRDQPRSENDERELVAGRHRAGKTPDALVMGLAHEATHHDCGEHYGHQQPVHTPTHPCDRGDHGGHEAGYGDSVVGPHESGTGQHQTAHHVLPPMATAEQDRKRHHERQPEGDPAAAAQGR